MTVLVVGIEAALESNLRLTSSAAIQFRFASSVIPGEWDVLVIPPSELFQSPHLRERSPSTLLLVYGEPHQMRSAWLSGIDDYLKNPWTPEELLLRIRGPKPRRFSWESNGSVFTLEGPQVDVEGTLPLTLTALEAAIVRHLVERRGLPVSRSVLAWSAGCSDSRVVDTLISRIRKRFDSHFGHGSACFQCIRNVGYCLS